MFDLIRVFGKRRSNEDVTVEVVGPHAVEWRGKRIDLTTGEPAGRAPGFCASSDGRHLNYADGAMVLTHADGRAVPLPWRTLPPYPFVWVGKWLVFQDDPQHKNDLAVLDTETGELRGRLDGLLVENGMKYPAVFDPRDGRTVWLGEGKHLRCFDVGALKWTSKVLAPKGAAFTNLVVLASGDLVAGLRHKGDQDLDALALLSPDGAVKKSVPLVQMSLARVGEHVIAFAHREKRFVVFDERLEEVASIPHVEDFATLVPLLDEGEWLAVGGAAQWFHFGRAGAAAVPRNQPTKPKPKPKPKAKAKAPKKPKPRSAR